ncbi:MAG: translocation/assembly module TamB domain-containing protein, partial [Saprospiraceae bacterium]
MKRYARTAIKVFLWLIVIIIALIILVLLALQTSPIQNLAKNKAVHFLQDKLKTPVAIGRLSVDFPKTVVLEGVYFGDRLGDTLLAGDTMKVDINMWKLLDRQVVIQEIDLRGITSHVTRTLSDSTYSFDYILKAFTSPKGTAQDTTAPMRFSLDKINLDRIHIKYADEVTGNDVSMLLRHFDTRITNFDLQHQKYSIPKITLDGLDVVMRQTKALSKKAVTTDTFNIPPPFTYPDVKFQEFDVSNVNIDFKNTVTAIDSKLGLGHLLIEMNDLNLPNQQIDIRLVHLDNTTGQFALGKTAQKAVIATSTEVVTTLQKGWNINLDKLEMDSINLKYNSLAAKKQTRGIDYNNLDLKDLVVDASHIVYAPDTIYGKVNQLNVKEGSGLEVKEFNGDIYYGKNTITLDHFVIETPRSHLSDQITLSYPSLDTLSKDAGALGLHGHFDENRLAVSDLLLFAPKLAYIDPFRKNQNSIMYISGNIDGQIKDLAISDLNISGIGSIQLHASGRIAGLPDVSKAYFDLHIDQFASNANDLNDLIPTGTIPSNIRIPDYIRANGNFKGTFKNFSTNLHTTSEYGLADINATLKNMSIKGKESYDATIKTSQFNIGRMMRREDKLGMITMAGSIKGHGMNPKTLNAILQGNIASLTYNGYTYQNLTLSGNAANGTMEGQAKMLDPNITFDLDAKADMNGTYPKLNFTLNADTINLQKLHFYQKELRLHGKIVANLTTADPDFLNGSIEITNAIIANETKKYKLDTISIVSVATEGEDSLNLTSEFLNVQLNGQYNLTDIYPALTGTIDKYIETNPGKDTVVTFKPQRIAFSARVIRSPLIEQILPDLTEMEDANLAGNFNSETGEIKIAGSVPRMRYKDYTVDNLKLDIETKIDALNYAITFDQLGSQKYQVRNTSLSGKAQNNILDVSLQVRDADDKEQYRIAGELRAISRLFEFKMLPDGLMLNYKSWNVAPDNAIQHGNEGWMVRNFKVSNGGQSMVINSSPQQLNAPMELEFNDFRIETFTRLISKDSLLAGGIINGHANVRNLNTNMVFTSDLTIGDFVFHGDTVGDVALKVNNETPNTYSANVTITGYGNEVKMLGSYYDDGTKSLYDLDVDIVKMNMKSVQAFTGGELKNSSGSVDGKLHIKGTLDAPDVRGDLHFQEAGFTVSRFNAHYKVSDETLSFTPEGLRFNQ